MLIHGHRKFMLRILLAGGGTAGHVNPALAIAEIIKDKHPDTQFCFAGTPDGLEAAIVPKEGYDFKPIKIKGFQRKLSLENIKRNIKAMGYLAISGHRSRQIIKEFNPDIVIGTGGYVSGPIVRTAAKMGIRTVIHEANAFPGVTTKILSKYVDKVMLTVKETAKYLDSNVKYTVTGLPVRKGFGGISKQQARERLGLPQNEICILSTGGSLGARVINEAVAKLFKWYQQNNIKINHIHSYGKYQGYKDYPNTLRSDGVDLNDKRIRLSEYVDMPVCMAAADLVISRCGANSLTELEAIGRGSILIPSPNVAENHQYYNGMVLDKAGAGICIEQKDFSAEWLINKIDELYNNREMLQALSDNAKKLYISDTPERVYGVLSPLIAGVIINSNSD